MKRLVILLITIVSLGLLSSSAWAIADDYYSLPTLEDTYKNRDLAKERFNKDMNTLKGSDWKRIIRSQPEVFDMTIDGKTRECYYEGKNIICE